MKTEPSSLYCLLCEVKLNWISLTISILLHTRGTELYCGNDDGIIISLFITVTEGSAGTKDTWGNVVRYYISKKMGLK